MHVMYNVNINSDFLLQRDFAVYQGDEMGASALVVFPSHDYTQFELVNIHI